MKAYPTLQGTPLPPQKHSLWRRFINRQLPNLVIFLMVATLICIVLYPHMVVSVPSGQVGVLWKRFGGGTVLDRRQLRDEGLHILLPWDKLFLYDLRLQSITETYHAITRDGVSLAATINVRFQLQHDYVPKLHVAAGPDYLNLLVRPEIGSRVREVIAEYTAEEVYSTKRQEIQDIGRERTKKMMGEMAEREPGEQQRIKLSETLNIYDVLILGIELPAVVSNAINRKIEQYYISEEYKFRVERERRESERKQIEAVGIRNFQQTVSQGISDSYLRWRGIEATLQLAQSTNTKVVIVGGGKDGLPIILGNVDSPAAAPPPATPPENETPREGEGKADGGRSGQAGRKDTGLGSDGAVRKDAKREQFDQSPAVDHCKRATLGAAVVLVAAQPEGLRGADVRAPCGPRSTIGSRNSTGRRLRPQNATWCAAFGGAPAFAAHA